MYSLTPGHWSRKPKPPPAMPHWRARTAIFWVLILSWPVLRLVEWVWHPDWYDDAETLAAAVNFTAFMIGRWLFQDTQREMCERVRENTQRIDGFVRAVNGMTGQEVTRPALSAVPAGSPGGSAPADPQRRAHRHSRSS